MQCSSLPQISGRGKTAMPFAISKHLTPHTSTHRPQPVHWLASTMGIHFAFMIELLRWVPPCLFHNDRAFHPRMRCTLEMHDAFLVESLFECRTGSQHRRRKFSFFSENTVRHTDIRILKHHGHAGLNGYRFR